MDKKKDKDMEIADLEGFAEMDLDLPGLEMDLDALPKEDFSEIDKKLGLNFED